LDAATLDVLNRAGGWVFSAAVLGSVIYAFMTGRIVQGRLLDRALNQVDTLVPAVDKLTTSVLQLTREVEELRPAAGHRR